MRVKVYQINREREKVGTEAAEFKDLSEHQKLNYINAKIYDEVFSGDVEYDSLKDMENMFNENGHPLYRGKALKTSDIIVTEGGAFYYDAGTLRNVYFDETNAQKPDDLLRVVYVEPNRRPFEAEIRNTLSSEQKAVGGLIEVISNDDGTSLVANEESKLIGMEGNRRIANGTSIIAGPFFVVGDDGEDFRSLTEKETAKYMKLFAEPERIIQQEVEADMEINIVGFWF